MDRARRAIPVGNKQCHARHVKKCQENHRRKLAEMKCSIDNKAPKRHPHLRKNLKKEQLMEERFAEIERDNRLLLEKMSYIMRCAAMREATRPRATERPRRRAYQRHKSGRISPRTRPQRAGRAQIVGGAMTDIPLASLARSLVLSFTRRHNSLDNQNPMEYAHSLNREQRKRELQKITRENQAILRRIQAAEPTYDHLAWAEHERTHEEYMKNICELPIRTKVGMTTMGGSKSGGAL